MSIKGGPLKGTDQPKGGYRPVTLQKESALAPGKSVRGACLEELEQLRDKYGHLEEVALGLVTGLAWVRQTGIRQEKEVGNRLAFLSWFLEQKYQKLSHEIYSAVVYQMIDLFKSMPRTVSFVVRVSVWHLENKLVSFLASREAIYGARSKVSPYLRDLVYERSYTLPRLYPQLHPQLDVDEHWERIVRALLRYKEFEVVREYFVDNTENTKRYAAVPALFKEVVEQVGTEEACWVLILVEGGWGSWGAIAKAFRLVDDARALRLLIDLLQAYIDEHEGKPYPLSGVRC